MFLENLITSNSIPYHYYNNSTKNMKNHMDITQGCKTNKDCLKYDKWCEKHFFRDYCVDRKEPGRSCNFLQECVTKFCSINRYCV